MEFLKYFITEEIYLLPDTRKKQADTGESDAPILTFDLSVLANTANEAETVLLKGILDATKIDPASIQMIQNFSEAKGKWILSFQNLPEVSGMPRYQVEDYKHSSLLISDPLSELLIDVEKKRKLWIALKQMVGV